MDTMTTLHLLNQTEHNLRIVINRLIIRLKPDVETEVQIRTKDEKLLLNLLQSDAYTNKIIII